MFNKRKIIRISIFIVIAFSLLINLVYLSYEKIYKNGSYAEYNNKIVNHYKDIHPDTFLSGVQSQYVRQQAICSNLKCPFGDIAIYYKLVLLSILMMAISVVVVLLLLIFKRYRKIILSRKDIFIIVGIGIISLFIFIWAFMLESDYYFTYCVKFL